MSGSAGILALWNDCAAERRREYEHWYQTEHLYERLGITGFLRGRRYASPAGSPQFFTYYETTAAQVLQSAEYLQRVEQPSELTRRVMSGVLTNMSRTACDVLYRDGRLRGAHACTFKLSAPPDARQWQAIRAALNDLTGLARCELWGAARLASRAATTEEKLRGGDASIAACLFVESLRASDAEAIVDIVGDQWAGAIVETGCYQLLCELEAER